MGMQAAWEWVSPSAADTQRLGERLGRRLGPGDVVTLSGDLGAGKTALSQAIGTGLEVREPVSSPTFALVHEYAGRVPVWHLDVYRLRSEEELVDLSWQDLLAGGGVLLVEWPERIEAALPAERLEVRLEYVDEDSRRVALAPHGERMAALVAELTAEMEQDAHPGD